MFLRLSLIGTSLLFLSAQSTQPLILVQKDHDWSLYQIQDQAHKDLGYLVSKPKKQEGSYDRRGPVWFFVFKRKESKPQVMIDLGYQTVPGQPYAAIFQNEKKYMLIPKGTKVYLEQNQTDAFCEDMKKNSAVHIYGVSSKQNKTTDTYNIVGFSSVFKKLMTH